MTDFPMLTYDALTVGEAFESDENIVTPEDIETYAFAVDDHHPWFSGPSPFGGAIAHPTFFGNQALRLRHTKYVVHAGLHAKMTFEFLEPIRPGMRVRSHGTVVDKYVRRDKKYMVTEFVTADRTGTALVRGRFTQMLIEPGTQAPSKAAASDHAGAGTMTAGPELPSLKKEITQRQIDAYSIVRANSIHTDERWAKAKGLRTTLAQGMMSTAYVSEMMTSLCGAGFVKGGGMSVAFIRPVYAGDRLTVHGVVNERTPEHGGTRVVVDVWCDNQHGEKTAAGTASGLLTV